MPLRVAVIGAGASGLAALHHLSSDPQNFSPMCYERGITPGGLWVYSENTGLDENGLTVQGSVYKGLRANITKELMGFVEYPMPIEYPSYPNEEQVKSYLNDYAEHFKLNHFIQFKSWVTKVTLVKDEGKVTWDVSVRNLASNDIRTERFDSVMVCNGHESVCRMPALPGREMFQGTITHSKDVRGPEPFSNKTVVILGVAFSGMELTFKISATAKQVYVCNNKYPDWICCGSKIPHNVSHKCGIREVTPGGVILTSGEYIACDIMVMTTGYHFVYPFLQEGCGISREGDRVTPLYKHLYHINHPTLCFIGLAKYTLHFRMSSAQAAHACSYLRGDVTLPSEREMLKDEENDFRMRVVEHGRDPRNAHNLLGPDPNDMLKHTRILLEYLETDRDVKSVNKMVQNFFDFHVNKLYKERMHDFQSLNVMVVDDETFVINE